MARRKAGFSFALEKNMAELSNIVASERRLEVLQGEPFPSGLTYSITATFEQTFQP